MGSSAERARYSYSTFTYRFILPTMKHLHLIESKFGDAATTVGRAAVWCT